MHVIGEITMSPPGRADNLLPLFSSHQTKPFDAVDTRLLQLGNHLQTSLEMEDILSRFNDHAQILVAHDYFAYSHDEHGIDFTRGKNGRFRLSYQLKINNQVLGTLCIGRRRKFTAEESQQFENLLCAVLYPLRNALLYRTALAAAHKDPLTGTGNRAAFNDALSREIELAHRYDRPLGMIVIDIDHFKKVNDNFGHATGDCLIRALANCADSTIRLSDLLFRYGGEEFVVLLPETATKGVVNLAERIRRNVAALDCACEGQHVRMTASFGVATLNDNDDEDSFFNRADKAMYQAKAEGRNCTRVAE
jgi:diguanylate cyclase (GGDEF)-like protein